MEVILDILQGLGILTIAAIISFAVLIIRTALRGETDTDRYCSKVDDEMSRKEGKLPPLPSDEEL